MIGSKVNQSIPKHQLLSSTEAVLSMLRLPQVASAADLWALESPAEDTPGARGSISQAGAPRYMPNPKKDLRNHLDHLDHLVIWLENTRNISTNLKKASDVFFG